MTRLWAVCHAGGGDHVSTGRLRQSGAALPETSRVAGAGDLPGVIRPRPTIRHAGKKRNVIFIFAGFIFTSYILNFCSILVYFTVFANTFLLGV